MKQPVITRDLERKAIYTDIIYDPEWTYVEVCIENTSSYTKSYTLDLHYCKCDFVVDWGDGTIEKNSADHRYKKPGTYTLRLKGQITFTGGKRDEHGLFDKSLTTKALQYGRGFDTNLGMFCGCIKLDEIDPHFFANKSDLTSVKDMFRGCDKLQHIPDGLFDPLINLSDVSGVFLGCGNITTIPERMFAKCKHIRNADNMLTRVSVHKLPDDLFEGLDELESAEYAFHFSFLTQIQSGLFSNKRKLKSLKGCFKNCDSVNIPEGLFDDCVNL